MRSSVVVNARFWEGWKGWKGAKGVSHGGEGMSRGWQVVVMTEGETSAPDCP